MSKNLHAFGLKVRILREKKQLTLESLSALSDINPAHIGLIERGQRNPTLTTILKIARGLNIKPGILFEDFL